MGHWAEIDENNIVIRVIVIKEAELDTGNWGDKSKWIKTSYNTRDGKHYVPNSSNQDFSVESSDQSKALRYRYAGVIPDTRVSDVWVGHSGSSGSVISCSSGSSGSRASSSSAP